MTFNVFQDEEQGTAWTLSVIFAPICTITTVLRFAATIRARRRIGWEHWFALLGLLVYLAYIGYVLYLTGSVNGRALLSFVKQQPETFHELLKFGDIMNGMYGIQQTFVKFSLLALYYRLFWISRHFTIAVWIIGFLQGGWGIAVLLVHVFACNPVAKVWNPTLPGTCIDSNLFFSIYEPINSAIDFFMAGMAIWMVRALQIKVKTRWHLSILFLIGAFSGVIGIIKVVEAQDAAQSNYLSIIWDVVQMGTSIICCCAPIFNSIFPKTNFLTSLRSWLSQTLIHRSSRYGRGQPEGIEGSNIASSEVYQGASKGLPRHAHWVPLEGSSDRGLAWADVEAGTELTTRSISTADTIAGVPKTHQSADHLH